jgi:rubrerythrin
MRDYYTTQQHLTNQQERHLARSATSLYNRSSRHALPTRHWSCTGCGTAHVGTLPEECVNCGGTALEFEYVTPYEVDSYTYA